MDSFLSNTLFSLRVARCCSSSLTMSTSTYHVHHDPTPGGPCLFYSTCLHMHVCSFLSVCRIIAPHRQKTHPFARRTQGLPWFLKFSGVRNKNKDLHERHKFGKDAGFAKGIMRGASRVSWTQRRQSLSRLTRHQRSHKRTGSQCEPSLTPPRTARPPPKFMKPINSAVWTAAVSALMLTVPVYGAVIGTCQLRAT